MLQIYNDRILWDRNYFVLKEFVKLEAKTFNMLQNKSVRKEQYLDKILDGTFPSAVRKKRRTSCFVTQHRNLGRIPDGCGHRSVRTMNKKICSADNDLLVKRG